MACADCLAGPAGWAPSEVVPFAVEIAENICREAEGEKAAVELTSWKLPPAKLRQAATVKNGTHPTRNTERGSRIVTKLASLFDAQVMFMLLTVYACVTFVPLALRKISHLSFSSRDFESPRMARQHDPQEVLDEDFAEEDFAQNPLRRDWPLRRECSNPLSFRQHLAHSLAHLRTARCIPPGISGIFM